MGGRAAVEAGGLAADEPEPVELGGDEGGVGDVAVQGDAERHQVHRDPHLAGVGRVHEGEEEDAAQEEGHQDEDAVHLVQQRVLHFELGEEGGGCGVSSSSPALRGTGGAGSNGMSIRGGGVGRDGASRGKGAEGRGLGWE